MVNDGGNVYLQFMLFTMLIISNAVACLLFSQRPTCIHMFPSISESLFGSLFPASVVSETTWQLPKNDDVVGLERTQVPRGTDWYRH